MKECFRCGASESKGVLFEAVHSSGVVNICKSCYFKLRLPIIDRKSIDWDRLDDDRSSVRDRLSTMAHVSVNDRTASKISSDNLRDSVEAGLSKPVVASLPKELIDNFNWIIMRKRRSLGFSQKQLGEKVGSTEVIIRALERGVVPRNYLELLPKIEEVISSALIKGNEIKFSSNSAEAFEKRVDSMRVVEPDKRRVDVSSSRMDLSNKGESISARNSKSDVVSSEKENIDVLTPPKKRSFGDHEEFTLRTDDFDPRVLTLSKVKEIVGEPVDSEPKYFDRKVENNSSSFSRGDIVINREDIRGRSFDHRSQSVLNSSIESRSKVFSDAKESGMDLERGQNETNFELDAISLDEITDSDLNVGSDFNDDLLLDGESSRDSKLTDEEIRRLSWGG